MNSMPEIDVILLSWNRSQMTVDAIKSILAQQEVSLKIWIVDQGSKQEELQVLKDFVRDYSNICITELEQNVGVPSGRNIGTFMGRAPYTVSIDNDAIFESNFALKKVINIFESEPQVGVISFRIKNFYNQKDDELSWVFPKGLKPFCESQFLTTRFVGCGHAIRRDVFEKAGGYDDALFFYWEEVDLSFRVINLGYQLIYTPEISVLHKVSPEARVRWEDNRFYYLVRNAIYISYKYNQSLLKGGVLVAGYSLKGLLNNLPRQTIRGVIDGILMCFSLRKQKQLSDWRLTELSQQYIWQHELRYRGNFWDRVSNEVLVGLPGRG